MVTLAVACCSEGGGRLSDRAAKAEGDVERPEWLVAGEILESEVGGKDGYSPLDLLYEDLTAKATGESVCNNTVKLPGCA